MKEMIFNVKGMHCKSCEMLIQDSLEELDGIESVKVSAEKETVKVVFDESKIKEDKIKAIISDQGDYEVK